MTPWEIIEEALAQKRPQRGPKWLAEQLGEKIQVVSNWKARGKVPPGRYREIAKVLGLTVDQLEGLAPLPWEPAEEPPIPGLLPEVAKMAAEVNALPQKQREWVMSVIGQSLELARESLGVTADTVRRNSEVDPPQPTKPMRRVNGR